MPKTNEERLLLNISPLDGRYAAVTTPLKNLFSEFALIQSRVEVELKYLLALDQVNLFPALTGEEKNRIKHLLESFTIKDAVQIKGIEATIRHDVKAIELFLRERLELINPNRIHFGLTSEDVNNLAYSMLFDRFVKENYIPALKDLMREITKLAESGADIPFPTRTHGQPASPSTAGKELAVWLRRLRKWGEKLKDFRFSGKCNGATGTWGSWLAASSEIDWYHFCKSFVISLGLEWNPITTQIEDHDCWAEFFNLTRQINNVLIDLDQDVWLWLMQGWYSEKAVSNEVGSSTMPHKVNPIRFENSEGNLLMANALLSFLSDKLCRSRLQRDLSDSTVSRNIGVALSHSYLGIIETRNGLLRLELQQKRCIDDITAHPQLLAEPIQTILRTAFSSDPYSLLKELTRGKVWEEEDLKHFITNLDICDDLKKRLLSLKVTEYIGAAGISCRKEIEKAGRFLEAE
ncbi:MAG: adenylosuccinate lyase [Candidatus Riflebacteria bacterium]